MHQIESPGGIVILNPLFHQAALYAAISESSIAQEFPQAPSLAQESKSAKSLHAGVRCAAEQRSDLEHLCRYITRPAIAVDRLNVNRKGQVVLKLKTAYRDGTSHIVMSSLEFMQRLAALVPRPRLHWIRFHGALAPNAKLRAAIVPIPPAHTTTGHTGECAHAHGARAHMTWLAF